MRPRLFYCRAVRDLLSGRIKGPLRCRQAIRVGRSCGRRAGCTWRTGTGGHVCDRRARRCRRPRTAGTGGVFGGSRRTSRDKQCHGGNASRDTPPDRPERTTLASVHIQVPSGPVVTSRWSGNPDPPPLPSALSRRIGWLVEVTVLARVGEPNSTPKVMGASLLHRALMVSAPTSTTAPTSGPRRRRY